MSIEEVLQRKKEIDAKIEHNKRILQHSKCTQSHFDMLNNENAELEKELKRLFPLKFC